MNSYIFPRTKLQMEIPQGKSAIILVLCGSFSPISLMHLRMMEMAKDWIKEHFPEKHVIGGYISPVSNCYQKEGLVEAFHRIEMCRLAVRDSDWLMVDDWECCQQEWSKTCLVMQHFQNEMSLCFGNEDFDIAFVMGSDLFKSIVKADLWNPSDVSFLLANCFFIVIERTCDLVELRMLIFENDLLFANKDRIGIIHQVIPTSMSSSLIRMLVKRKFSIRYLVHDEVEKYIRANALFFQ